MSEREATAAVARRIVDENLYMTIGTADEDGAPWVSPVYYAPAGYSELFWVSHPEARHSRNIEVRPQVAIVIFDSRIPIGTGQAVYISAQAALVEDDAEVEAGIGVFSSRSQEHGAQPWTPENVAPSAGIRLYRARVSEHFVLGSRDERVPVRLE
jgi:nitroimidazol reductase NimA-like FMN-containing flavoprotein (pyridoxamine 5'-phosphate oxidase superfamily)